MDDDDRDPRQYAGVILVPVFVALVLLTGSASQVPWSFWAGAAAMFGYSAYALYRDT